MRSSAVARHLIMDQYLPPSLRPMPLRSDLMRQTLRLSLVAAAILALVASAVAPTRAFAITCTDRQKVCFAYCEKNYHNAPPCLATCNRLLGECMSNGCWDSK